MPDRFLLAARSLLGRELRRFWREKGRVIGFVATPLIFWIVVGAGFGDLQRFFAGSLALTVMMAAVFSMMSLIEDRREGFLVSVLASPAPRAAIVAGKIGGAAILAWLQGLLFLCCAPLAGFALPLLDVLALAGALLLIALLFTALGFLGAWRIDSTQGFHAIMNLILFPLWMISGALFPLAGAHGWMQSLMRANPLTYAVALLERLLGRPGDPAALPSLVVTTVATVVLLFLAVRQAR
jgi:ABC-2 type transport system permease protein